MLKVVRHAEWQNAPRDIFCVQGQVNQARHFRELAGVYILGVAVFCGLYKGILLGLKRKHLNFLMIRKTEDIDAFMKAEGRYIKAGERK